MSQALWNQMFADGASLVIAKAHGSQIVGLRPSGPPILGTLFNGATAVSPPMGRQDGEAMYFNGLDQYAALTDSNDVIDVTDDWSCFFCFRTVGAAQDEHDLLKIGNTTSGIIVRADTMNQSTGGNLRCALASGGVSYTRESSSTINLQHKQIYTVGIARQSAQSRVRITIDGSVKNGGTLSLAVDTNAPDNLYVGVSNPGAASPKWSNVEIWNLAFFPNVDLESRFPLYNDMARDFGGFNAI